MTYELYRTIFQFSLIGFFVLLALTLVLFFTLKIPTALGYITGRTQRHGIDEIRRRNQSGGRIRSQYRPPSNGRVTDRITKSGNIETVKVQTTELLEDAKPYSVGLTENICDSTTMLQQPIAQETETIFSGFCVEYELTFIHTDEIATEAAV